MLVFQEKFISEFSTAQRLGAVGYARWRNGARAPNGLRSPRGYARPRARTHAHVRARGTAFLVLMETATSQARLC